MTIKLMRLKLSIAHQVITLLRELIEVIEQINKEKLRGKLIWESRFHSKVEGAIAKRESTVPFVVVDNGEIVELSCTQAKRVVAGWWYRIRLLAPDHCDLGQLKLRPLNDSTRIFHRLALVDTLLARNARSDLNGDTFVSEIIDDIERLLDLGTPTSSHARRSGRPAQQRMSTASFSAERLTFFFEHNFNPLTS